MESLVIVLDDEKVINTFREIYSEDPFDGTPNPNYREVMEDGIYGAIVDNVVPSVFDFYFSNEFYYWFPAGSYKVGQFIKKEGDATGWLSGFCCNCADTDLPMIEDIYEKINSLSSRS